MNNEDKIKQEAFRLFPFVEDKRASNGELYQSDSYRQERELFIKAATFGLSLQTNEWISVTPETMPTKEVLAYNGCNYLLGHLKVSNFDKEIICESENEQMYSINHYLLPTPPNK